ncbi:hypothetical protein SK128_020663, partial [Halocaridina rubra]
CCYSCFVLLTNVRLFASFSSAGYDGPLQYAMTDGASPDAAMTTVQVLPAVGQTSDFTDDEEENANTKNTTGKLDMILENTCLS